MGEHVRRKREREEERLRRNDAVESRELRDER